MSPPRIKEIPAALIKKLSEAKLLTLECKRALFEHIDHVEELAVALFYLQEKKLLTASIQTIVCRNAPHAKQLVVNWQGLEAQGRLTSTHCGRLLQAFYQAPTQATANLPRESPRLLSPSFHQTAQITNREYALKALNALRTGNLLTARRKAVIFQHTQHAKEFASALIQLTRFNILDESIDRIMCEAPQHAATLASGLLILHLDKLLTNQYQMKLLKFPQYADQIANGIVLLMHQGILTEHTFIRLINHPQKAHQLASSLVKLHQSSILPPTDSIAMEVKEDALHFATALQDSMEKAQELLKTARLFTEPRIAKLHMYALYAPTLANNLVTLASNLVRFSNLEILTAENEIALFADFDHVNEVAKGIINLHRAKLLTDKNRNMLLKHTPHANSIAIGIIALHERDNLTEENCTLSCILSC